MGIHLGSPQLKSWDMLHVEGKTGFPGHMLVGQTEEEYQQLTEVEKEEAVVLTVSQEIR